MHIYVNTRKVEILIDIVSYESAARLAFPSLSDVPSHFTVTYHGANGPKPDGVLRPGEWVMAKDGAVFSVADTEAGR